MALLKQNILLALFLVLLNTVTGFGGGWAARNTRRASKEVDAPPVLPDMWLEQQLDHFDHTNMQTWKQRYFVNATFWDKSNGPVFLLIGGEGPNNPQWLVADTEIMVNARKYSALVLTLEHRFYGKSHPTADLSVENLKYLSSQQALADLAYFRAWAFNTYGMHSTTKWIVFGGSYSGNLAAWFRLKYPQLVVGAVASSAPLQAELNFSQYLEVVTESLTSAGGAACTNAIAAATAEFARLYSKGGGDSWQYLEKLFKVSPSLKTVNDWQNLANSLAGNFMGIVQYNKDNVEFEGRILAATMTELCEIMKSTHTSELERYAAVNSKLLAFGNQTSLDARYDPFIAEMRNTSWEGPASEGGRQWTYQTCTEFAYFQTTDSTKQVFGSMFPLKFSVQQCVDIYGPQFAQTAIANAVAWSNTYYGGKDITCTSASNIVFPNGSVDPWHALGLTAAPTQCSDLEAIFIDGTAHCANMYPASETDVPGLKAARLRITETIGKWL